MGGSVAPVQMPADLPACAAVGLDREGHEHRHLLRQPPLERLLERLQALPEPGKQEGRGMQRELHGCGSESVDSLEYASGKTSEEAAFSGLQLRKMRTGAPRAGGVRETPKCAAESSSCVQVYPMSVF